MDSQRDRQPSLPGSSATSSHNNTGESLERTPAVDEVDQLDNATKKRLRRLAWDHKEYTGTRNDEREYFEQQQKLVAESRQIGSNSRKSVDDVKYIANVVLAPSQGFPKVDTTPTIVDWDNIKTSTTPNHLILGMSQGATDADGNASSKYQPYEGIGAHRKE